MNEITLNDLKGLYVAPRESHKGQNGRMLLIGGSHLFHAASLWSLTVASRIVDLVHYASVPENNQLIEKAKEEFRNGIVISRNDIEAYIEEDDCLLIGPGMTRDEETKQLTDTLLKKYPHKQWVIDAGALQMMDIEEVPQNAILTPHHGEFESLRERLKMSDKNFELSSDIYKENVSEEEKVQFVSKALRCIILLKGSEDIVSNGITGEVRRICGGNAGMTKGGTGDVLSGLIAALACKNDPYLATIAGSWINKQAGDSLYQNVGPFFNATDLANEIPKIMKTLLSSRT